MARRQFVVADSDARKDLAGKIFPQMEGLRCRLFSGNYNPGVDPLQSRPQSADFGGYSPNVPVVFDIMNDGITGSMNAQEGLIRFGVQTVWEFDGTHPSEVTGWELTLTSPKQEPNEFPLVQGRLKYPWNPSQEGQKLFLQALITLNSIPNGDGSMSLNCSVELISEALEADIMKPDLTQDDVDTLEKLKVALSNVSNRDSNLDNKRARITTNKIPVIDPRDQEQLNAMSTLLDRISYLLNIFSITEVV